MLKDIFKILLVLLTLFINAILIYGLLVSPFSRMLVDKNQPFDIPPPNFLIEFTTIFVIGLVITTSIILIVKLFWKREIFFYAPIFSLLVFAGIVAIGLLSPAYPDSESAYEKDGYYYKIEIWYNESDHLRTYKRWKSVQSYNGNVDPKFIEYKLDSLSQTKNALK